MKFLIAALAALSLFAAPPDPVTWKAEPPPRAVKAGARFSVRVIARIQEGWHIYGLRPVANGPIATRIWVADGLSVQSGGAVDGSDPQTMVDPAFGIEVQTYEGEVSFNVPLRISTSADVGDKRFFVNASYQSCDSKICLPPKTVKLDVPVTVTR